MFAKARVAVCCLLLAPKFTISQNLANGSYFVQNLYSNPIQPPAGSYARCWDFPTQAIGDAQPPIQQMDCRFIGPQLFEFTDLGNGFYRILAVYTGNKILGVSDEGGSAGPGKPITVSAVGPQPVRYQWRAVPADVAGYWTFVNRDTGLCIDHPSYQDAEYGDGKKIQQMTCNNSEWQKWKLIPPTKAQLNQIQIAKKKKN